MRKYIGGGWVYGVPARDLTEDEWHRLTPEQQTAAAHLYRQPRKASKAFTARAVDPAIVLEAEAGIVEAESTQDITQES